MDEKATDKAGKASKVKPEREDRFTSGDGVLDVTPKGSKVKVVKLPPEFVKKINGKK